MATLAERVAELERLVAELQSSSPSQNEGLPGVCRKGNDPDTCPVASTYQYQHKCKGTACKAANSKFYKEHPRGKKPVETPVAAPKRRMVKRART